MLDNNKIKTLPNGCWEWIGLKARDGYGRVKRNGRETGPHRVMYEIHNGPIPDGLVLDHLCRNPACVNPDHLEPVTQRENVLRGIGVPARNAAKVTCPRGHPYDAQNTIMHRGWRSCRACSTDRGKTEHRRAAKRSWYHRTKSLRSDPSTTE